ncbi:Uncharacterized protein dnm_010640 [Desulfonema magnum]|uniref:Uncharacterized protein n=1 Tax=Desulfonema magnum TaxID=45655 RepID=A0A975BHC6_9BACT|nr:Uncharacterized protein dnm_010640 [Desulfonema magnum]
MLNQYLNNYSHFFRSNLFCCPVLPFAKIRKKTEKLSRHSSYKE